MLVHAPAHPRFPNRPDIVEYEVRRTVDGHLVLPVFTTRRRLVKMLGEAQPWVQLPLESVESALAVDPAIRVVVDPGMTQDLWTWTPEALREAVERYDPQASEREVQRVG